MSRVWAPGTVAMIAVAEQHERRAVRVGNIGWHLRPSLPGEEEAGTDFVLDDRVIVVRPLVVIDPEDMVQVAALAKKMMSHGCRAEVDLQSALRAFITPPRPQEPTGLGAVVEAIHDNHFVRVDRGPKPWHRVGDHSFDATCSYEEIVAVRVLSEGVTP